MKIYLFSCHETAEYDMCRMFLDIGHEVSGDFDCGGRQRPKLKGTTDHSSPLADPDVVVLHQVPEYHLRMRELLDKGHRVIITAFGCSDGWQYREMSDICRQYPHAWVAAYSEREYGNLLRFRCPYEKCHLIRFGKYFSDYQDWQGDWPLVLAGTNSWHKRGHGCFWPQMEELRKHVPNLVFGKETEEVSGLGELRPGGLLNAYAHCRCFVSFGTYPASVVLSLIDGICAGTPMVIFDNKQGIAEEPLRGVIVEDRLESLIWQCKKLIDDREYAEEKHKASLACRELFNAEKIKLQWKELFEKVVS